MRQRLAIIPARGGSRRIRGKNIAEIEGRPAIEHVIRTAQASELFERILVTTEDAEIEKAARVAGAEVVARPSALADDWTPLMSVVSHAVRVSGSVPNVVCLVMATAIFISSHRLREAATILDNDDSLDYVIGVKAFESPPQRALVLSEKSDVSMLMPENFGVRSQDLQPLYHDAGQFSIGRTQAWLEGRPSFTSKTRALVLGKWEAIDIDEPEDLAFARELFAMRRSS